MSAQIPSTMLLSDLLKATGYDCPEELQGKTFEEATSGGDAKISTNTEKTIDVSAYTEPVVVEPAEGYDATKKVTVTLDNIPVAATNVGWMWSKQLTGSSDTTYVIMPFDKAPATMASHDATDKQYFGYKLAGKSIASVRYGITIPTSDAEETITDLVYTKVSDTSFKVSWTGTVTGEEPINYEVTYTYVGPIFSTNPWD